MPKQVEAPIYWRNGRAYLDARAYAEVGGGQERLVPPGEKLATKDPIIARQLAARRIKELEELRRRKTLHGVIRVTTLRPFAQHHLEEKARSESATDQCLESVELHLKVALDYFGDCDLLTIDVTRVQEFAKYLTTLESWGKPLGPGTRRKYLNSLSNLFRRAASEGYVQPNYNPVAALLDKPKAVAQEAKWLEVHEAALLLEAVRRVQSDRSDRIAPMMLYAIIATYFLTGGREKEVLGLEVSDISFDRKTVTFRRNQWRRLKSNNGIRVVPLWPQLEEILRRYVFDRDAPLGLLLFPSPRMSHEAMITDIRKALDAAGKLVGWEPGEIRTKPLRHTYCSARLQTLDRGAPVSEFTVAKELGHGGSSLVRKVYGHLGQIRHRSEFVEYRVEQHLDSLRDRLRALPQPA
jgi:integrase